MKQRKGCGECLKCQTVKAIDALLDIQGLSDSGCDDGDSQFDTWASDGLDEAKANLLSLANRWEKLSCECEEVLTNN